MVEWTKEAEQEARDVYRETYGDMRAALDAAVKAQGHELIIRFIAAKIRAEALEEVIRLTDEWEPDREQTCCYDAQIDACLALIRIFRSLKDKPANQTDGGK